MKKKLLSAVSFILVLTMIMAFPLEVFAKGKEPGKKPKVGPAPEVRSGEFDEQTEPAAEETVSYYAGNITGESKNYKAVVTVDESAEIPEGTVAKVTEFAKGSAEYEEAKAKVAAEKGEEFEGFAAFDISLYNGEEMIEPASTVKVSIEAKGLPENATDVEISHIDESKGETVVELVASADDIIVDGDTINAEIAVDGFSTFVLTWSESESATIHFGTMNGDTFTEFAETTIAFDTNASTISLDVSREGYLFRDAVYCESESVTVANGVDMDETLYKTADGWAADLITSDGDDTVVTRTSIAAGSHIYVIYYQPGTPTPSGASDDTIPSPTTTKQVIHNADGTYTIQLDVVGATVTEDNSHYVNVLVILDATRSMNGSKWTNAKAAMKALIETMTEGENAANAGKIDFALVTFGRSATVTQNWTKNNAAFKTTCANINMVSTSGTNWEAGMRGGLYGVLNNLPDNDPTYVIFLTDGDPNVYYSSGSATNYTDTGTTWNTSASSSDSANHSKDEAKSIAAITKLYGIYCGDSGQNPSGASYNRLVDVITGAGQGGQKTIAANADTIESEFKAIAETALKDMGANNVAVDDGVPSLSSISATVAGEASGFEYYISNDKGQTYTTWADAPGATYSQDNGVSWDLTKVGTVTADSYYRLKFTVWPSQEAYDLIADLNNKLVTKTEAELDALGIAQNDDGVYYLLTNTHLNTKYTYKDKQYSDSPNETPTDEMILPTTLVNVVKYWNNDLDDRTAIENAKVHVTKDGVFYEEVDLGTFTKVPGYDHRWVQTPDKDIYISMGQLTLNTTTNAINVISSGHDYSVMEPEAYSHNWWLTADVYHPMLVNGVPTVLVEVKEADVPSDLKNLADNMHAVSGGKDYYKFNRKLYVAQNAQDNILYAINDRRSHLNFTKTVTGTGAPADAYFTYRVTVTDSEGKDIWFSVAEDTTGATIVKDPDIVTGATAQEGNTGYWFFKSGGTATIKIKAGWNVRFINLPVGATYEIVEVESAMEDGWIFTKAESSIESDYEATPATISGSTASGTIDMANTKYIVTYTNEYLGYFYIYHSSNNTVERYAMAENGVKVTSFNIFGRTAEGTLYGGYYKDYAGKSENFDAAVLDYSGSAYPKDEGGKAYTYAYIKEQNRAVWKEADAYAVSGKAMVPEQNNVYYLKEVPTAYILPYTHYTYNKADKLLRNMWYLTAIDDLNYQAAGFFVETFDANGKKTGTIVDTLKVTNTSGGATVTLSPSSLFGNKGGTGKGVQAGYLSYWDAKALIKENATSVFTPFWHTPDGIYVCGTQTRTVKFNNAKVGTGGMRITDAANTTPFPALES